MGGHNITNQNGVSTCRWFENNYIWGLEKLHVKKTTINILVSKIYWIKLFPTVLILTSIIIGHNHVSGNMLWKIRVGSWENKLFYDFFLFAHVANQFY